MSRYVRDVVLNKPDDFVQFIMNDFLGKNQYQLIDQKGESVYRAATPMHMAAPSKTAGQILTAGRTEGQTLTIIRMEQIMSIS